MDAFQQKTSFAYYSAISAPIAALKRQFYRECNCLSLWSGQFLYRTLYYVGRTQENATRKLHLLVTRSFPLLLMNPKDIFIGNFTELNYRKKRVAEAFDQDKCFPFQTVPVGVVIYINKDTFVALQIGLHSSLKFLLTLEDILSYSGQRGFQVLCLKSLKTQTWDSNVK